MSTFGLTWNLKSPDRNKQFISNIPRIFHRQNVDLFIYWDKYGSQFIEYQENKQPRKISKRKIYAYTGMLWAGISEKWGYSHTNEEKSGQPYTFCWKQGANHKPDSAEKGGGRGVGRGAAGGGGHSARTSVLCRTCTVDSRYLEIAYLESTKRHKILWKRDYSSFPQYFQYI